MTWSGLETGINLQGYTGEDNKIKEKKKKTLGEGGNYTGKSFSISIRSDSKNIDECIFFFKQLIQGKSFNLLSWLPAFADWYLFDWMSMLMTN